MTVKEKAKDLVDRFNKAEGGEWDFIETNGDYRESTWRMSHSLAKQCALIAVDELIKPMEYEKENNWFTQHLNPSLERYWQEVKNEIEKL